MVLAQVQYTLEAFSFICTHRQSCTLKLTACGCPSTSICTVCPGINCTVCFIAIERTFIHLLEHCVVVTNSEETTGSPNDSDVSPVNDEGKDGTSDDKIGKLTDFQLTNASSDNFCDSSNFPA